MPAVFILPLMYPDDWRNRMALPKPHNNPSRILISPFELNQQEVEEYKAMFFLKYGIKLSFDEAKKRAIEIMLAVKASYKPIPKKPVAN